MNKCSLKGKFVGTEHTLVWIPKPVCRDGSVEYEIPRDGDVVHSITIIGVELGTIMQLLIGDDVVWSLRHQSSQQSIIVPYALNLVAIGYHTARLVLKQPMNHGQPNVKATYKLFDDIEYRIGLSTSKQSQDWWRYHEPTT